MQCEHDAAKMQRRRIALPACAKARVLAMNFTLHHFQLLSPQARLNNDRIFSRFAVRFGNRGTAFLEVRMAANQIQHHSIDAQPAACRPNLRVGRD